MEDEAFQQVIQEATYRKAVPVYKRFTGLGKEEGAISPDIPTETILEYIFQVMSLLERKEYLQSSEEHKKKMVHLFYTVSWAVQENRLIAIKKILKR